MQRISLTDTAIAFCLWQPLQRLTYHSTSLHCKHIALGSSRLQSRSLIPRGVDRFARYRMCTSLRRKDVWKELHVADGYLCLGLTLGTGQTFRFNNFGIQERAFPTDKATEDLACEEWAGVIAKYVIALRGEIGGRGRIWWRLVSDCKKGDLECVEQFVRDYFRADFDYREVMNGWCRVDANYQRVFRQGYGKVRLLRQDPVETLLAFTCSSNNNIKRITGMVQSLALMYGNYICSYEGLDFYEFPNVKQLLENVSEKDLRERGFGYRAAFLDKTVKLLHTLGGAKYLQDLRTVEDPEAVIEALIQFSGVGRKVASCVALMSLDKLSVIPVDTHVWQFTSKHYLPKLRGKSLTSKLHQEINDFYLKLFGKEAGIAHNALFVADLNDTSHQVLLQAACADGS